MLSGPGLILVITLAALALLAAVLVWQARVKAAPYDAMFKVRQPSGMHLARTAEGWRLTVQEGADSLSAQPVALSVGPSPTEMSAPIALTPSGSAWTAPGPHPCPRAYFTIHLADGQTRATAERILPLEGVANFRDVGGYRAQDGRRMAWGRLYRSSDLHRASDSDWDRIRALGIGLVVDLRSKLELKKRPDRVPPDIAYLYLPIYAVNPMSRLGVLFRRGRLDARFRRLYRDTIIDAGAAAFGELLRKVTQSAELPFILHCTSGKDRTGIAAVLLLHICGVDRETIIADYSLTNLAIERALASLETLLRASGPRLGIRIPQLYPLMSARPALIEHALEHIDETYGSIDAYLRGPVGLSEREIAAIRRNLLESA